MRKLFFVFLIVFTTIFISSASWSLPNWVVYELKKYPLDTYLFHVGRSDGTGSEAFRTATAEANRKVAEKILEKVSSIIRYNQNDLEYDMVREHYSAVLEDYCSQRQENPALNLEGFSMRNLSVDMARTEEETYSFVYIKRDELKAIYAKHADRLQERIQRQLEIARVFENNMDIEGAIRNYLRTYPLYESLKEAEIIQIGAEYIPNYNGAFQRMVDAATRTSDKLWAHRQVIRHVEELTKDVIVNFNDVCRFLDSQLSQQSHLLSGSIAVYPLIYQDSEMPSPLAEMFTRYFQKQINGTRIDEDLSRRLSPTCWVNGDEITIRAILRDMKTGEFLASAVVRYLKSQLRDTLTYKPRGYDQVQVEKQAFKPRYYKMEKVESDVETSTSEILVEHTVSPIGGLEVDVWTGEGRDHVFYTEGDQVRIYTRVNQPAYLRLLYTLADQRRTLLIDNFHIGASEVNRPVEIGTFRCIPPLGTEFLVVAARTEEFPEIQTQVEGEYNLLVGQDVETAVQSFRALPRRGLKLIQKESNEQQLIDPPQNDKHPTFQQSEAQLMLTIMER